MKEILKYLRQLNSFSQEEISQKLGVSRQTYFKYEKGEVFPKPNIVTKISSIYKVSVEFLYANKIPLPAENNEKKVEYSLEEKTVNVAEPSVSFSSEENYYEGVFDGKAVQFLENVSSLGLKVGQKFKLFVEKDDSAEREEAWQTLMKIVNSKPMNLLPEDVDYKEAIYEALEEKYGI